MRTMIWKEWRENLKWAVLAMLALGLAEYYALFQEKLSNSYGLWNTPRETLTKGAFLMMTTFGNAAAGLILALLQFAPEQRRDQWAALLHRPVSRSVVFSGKIVAGIVLYLLATGVPFLASVWCVATPGHFAVPFVAGMARPGMADMAAGLIYYFVGILLALDRGRWFALRIAAFLAAVYVSLTVVAVGYVPFPFAVATCLFAAALAAAAAWGAMLSNGSFEARPWLGRASLLLVVFYGACGLGTIVWRIQGMGRGYYSGSEFAVSQEGQLLLLHREKDYSLHVTDVENHPVTDPRYVGDQIDRNVERLNYVSSYIGDAHGIDDSEGEGNYRNVWAYLNEIFDSESERWFYVRKEKVVKGYALYGARPLGELGRDGFQAAPARAVPFPSSLSRWTGNNLKAMGDGKNLYLLDAERRGLVPVPLDGPFFGMESYEKPDENRFTVLAVLLRQGIALFGPDAKPLGLLPYNPERDIDRWGSLLMARKQDGSRYYVMYQPSGWLDYRARSGMPFYLDEMDAQGRILHTVTIPPEKPGKEIRKVSDYVSAAVTAPLPYLGGIAWTEVRALAGDRSAKATLKWMFGMGRGAIWFTATCFAISSVILAGLAYLWALRSAFPRSAAWRWALFVLAFNLGGLVAFRLAADWPVRLKCPACGKPRRVDDPDCPHCGAAWPVPERDGTEIFDGNAGGRPEEALRR